MHQHRGRGRGGGGGGGDGRRRGDAQLVWRRGDARRRRSAPAEDVRRSGRRRVRSRGWWRRCRLPTLLWTENDTIKTRPRGNTQTTAKYYKHRAANTAASHHTTEGYCSYFYGLMSPIDVHQARDPSHLLLVNTGSRVTKSFLMRCPKHTKTSRNISRKHQSSASGEFD